MKVCRYILLLFVVAFAPIACFGNIFSSMKDGADFGVAIGKAGGNIRQINNVMEEMYRLEDAGQFYSAAQLGVGLYSQFRKMGADVMHTKAYARFLTHLSTDLNAVGISSAAIYYGLEAETLFAKLVDEKDDEYIIAVKNLAAFYYAAGDIAESEIWLDKCLSIIQNNPKQKQNYYEALNTKACIYNYTGRPQMAIELEEQIIREYKNTSPPCWKATGRIGY